MAVDKLVDSTQLDSDLTSVANAIRTKGGTSAQLAFPSGFVSAIQNIPSGGSGYSLDDIAEGAITGAITLTADSVEEGVFTYNTRLTSVTANGAISLKGHAFYYCSYVTKVFMPSCTINGNNSMEGMSRLQTAVIGNLNTSSNWYLFKSCTALTAVDIIGTGSLTQQAFSGCTNLATIILRSPSIIGLGATSVFDNSPFKSGGSGGTIYIPKSLYDHLGDGTSNDYKAATNWSTIDGRGVITWAKIEGSIYETQYVDGTAIPSA